MRRSIIAGLVVVIASWSSFCARAETVVYDNTTSLWTDSDGGTNIICAPKTDPLVESGDEVHLAGTARIGKKLDVIVAPAHFDALTSNVVLSLYDNTGVDGAPNNLLWRKDLGQVTLLSTGLTTLSADLGGVRLPDTVTWTIQVDRYSDGSASDFGLVVYDAPSIGSSDNHSLWCRYDGSWNVATDTDIGGCPANFGARITAEVPEPASIGILGAIVAALYGWRRRVVCRSV